MSVGQPKNAALRHRRSLLRLGGGEMTARREKRRQDELRRDAQHEANPVRIARRHD